MSENADSGAAIMASCPGGMARQFRVQVSSGDSPPCWQHAGSFADWGQARSCALQLQEAGEQIRVIACRSLPTAA